MGSEVFHFWARKIIGHFWALFDLGSELFCSEARKRRGLLGITYILFQYPWSAHFVERVTEKKNNTLILGTTWRKHKACAILWSFNKLTFCAFADAFSQFFDYLFIKFDFFRVNLFNLFSVSYSWLFGLFWRGLTSKYIKRFCKY